MNKYSLDIKFFFFVFFYIGSDSTTTTIEASLVYFMAYQPK